MLTKNKPGFRRGLGAQGSRLLSKLSAGGAEVFTVREAKMASGFGGGRLRKLLHDLAKNKWVKRVERGKYLILPLEAGLDASYGTHPFVIARKLVSPYYIGFWSALNHHGFTEQPSPKIFIASTKSRKSLRFQGQDFRFVHLPKKRFFGITAEFAGNSKFNVSDKEKTAIDCLFLPKYSGGLVEVAKAFGEELDYGKLCKYALAMNDLSTLKRLGFLLDALGIKTPAKEKLLKKVGGGFCLLDPSGPKGGGKNKKWRVIENIEAKEVKA